MSIRTIRYELDESGNFERRTDYSGVQYENRATAVEYVITNEFENALLNISGVTDIEYRIDFDSDAYGYNPSVNLQKENGVVRREIPGNVNSAGECRVNLVAIAKGANGVITTVSSPQSRICFLPVIRTGLGDFFENIPDLSAFTVNLQNLLQEIGEKQTELENLLEDLEENAELISGAKDYCGEAKTYCGNIENSVTAMEQNISRINESINSFVFSQLVLPEVAASDNGKFLRVANGRWQAVNISDGREEGF